MAHAPDPKEEALVDAIALALSRSSHRTPEVEDYDSAREIVEAMETFMNARIEDGIKTYMRNELRGFRV